MIGGWGRWLAAAACAVKQLQLNAFVSCDTLLVELHAGPGDRPAAALPVLLAAWMVVGSTCMHERSRFL
jgi:hypothetical protein